MEQRGNRDQFVELIEALRVAYLTVGAKPQMGDVFEPLLGGLTSKERAALGEEITNRMWEWHKTHPGEVPNPYAGPAYYLKPTPWSLKGIGILVVKRLK